MEVQVNEVLDELRPMLIADGGDIDLIAIEDGIVSVRLRGACAGCPAAATTLYEGVERLLKEKVPGIRGIQEVK